MKNRYTLTPIVERARTGLSYLLAALAFFPILIIVGPLEGVGIKGNKL